MQKTKFWFRGWKEEENKLGDWHWHVRHCGCSAAKSCSLWPHRLQHTRLPCPSLPPGACSDSYPLSQWCLSYPLALLSPFAFNLSQHQGLDIYTLLYIKQITNKDLLPSTGNTTQYSTITYMGTESKRDRIYVYV